MGLPDIIIYFGPLEFTVLVAGLLLVLSLLLVLRQRRTRLQARRRLLDSLPYPALLFHGKRLAACNSAAESWQDNLDLQALAIEALRTRHTIVRTIPAVEGQAYQVRAVYLPARETLLLLEDMAAARRQQAFYRNFINTRL